MVYKGPLNTLILYLETHRISSKLTSIHFLLEAIRSLSPFSWFLLVINNYNLQKIHMKHYKPTAI